MQAKSDRFQPQHKYVCSVCEEVEGDQYDFDFCEECGYPFCYECGGYDENDNPLCETCRLDFLGWLDDEYEDEEDD